MEDNVITTPAGNKIQQLTGPDSLKGGKRSAWMSHVKKTMRANKGKPLSAVLKMAAKTYKKTAKVSKKKKNRGMFGMYGGGGVASTAGNVGGVEIMSNYMGGRRRGTKKNGSKLY